MLHVSCFMFHVSCFMFHVSCFMFRVSCFMFHVSCFVFHVSCSMFHVSCFMFHVSCFMFRVSCFMFRVPCSIFHLIFPKQCVYCFMSHTTEGRQADTPNVGFQFFSIPVYQLRPSATTLDTSLSCLVWCHDNCSAKQGIITPINNINVSTVILHINCFPGKRHFKLYSRLSTDSKKSRDPVGPRGQVGLFKQ
jgi:hypothetical protein